jgi:hypothetical protein
MTTTEQVRTLTTPVEPLTGDKRHREDGVMDEGPPSLPPASRNGNNNFGNNPAGFQQQQQSMMNGNFMQSMMAGGRLQLIQNNGDPIMPGHDALYIGDLQWVRLLCRLLSTCVYLSKLFFLSSRPFPPCFSGQLMKICAK